MKPTIGLKLSLGFLAMLILLVGTIVVGMININTMAQTTDTVAQEAKENRSLLTAMGAADEAIYTLENAVAAEGTSASYSLTLKAKYLHDYLDSTIRGYVQTAAGSEVEELMQELETAHSEFSDMYQKYIDTLSKGDTIDQEESIVRIEGTGGKLMTALTTLEDKNRRDINVAQAKAQLAHSSALTLMLVLGMTAPVLGIALSIVITRSITRPIANLVKVADNISMGNLDMFIEVTSRDEIGGLQESIERMRVSLKTAIEKLKMQR